MLEELKVGGRNWARQLKDGFPLVGSIPEPGVNPAQRCPGPELSPEKLLVSSKWGLKAKRANVTGPYEGLLRKEAMNQVAKGWLGGPYGFDEEGGLVAS